MPRLKARQDHLRISSFFAWLGYFFLVVPSLVVIPISFSTSSEIAVFPHRLSLHLYREFFHSSNWWPTTVQSFRVATLATVLALIVATPAAYALVRYEVRGKRLIHLVFLSPLFTPVVVIGLGSYLYFAYLGIGGTTLVLVFAHAVMISPFVLIAIMAGLRHIDPTLETAAMLMGASRWMIFGRVVLPQIVPALAAGALLGFLVSFDEVVIAYFVTSPVSQTLPVKMYSAIQWEISPVIAAVSTLLTASSLVISLAISLLQKPAWKAND